MNITHVRVIEYHCVNVVVVAVVVLLHLRQAQKVKTLINEYSCHVIEGRC